MSRQTFNYGDIKGNDATINGKNTIEIRAGSNITIDQEEGILTINATEGGSKVGTYAELPDKPSINNIELNGNKSLEDLGITNYDDTELRELIDDKQETLISGTNIKTVNNQSLLGNGNINIEGSGTDKYLSGVEVTTATDTETVGVEKTSTIGAISTATGTANGRDANNYWFITNLAGWQAVIGKTLKAITLKAGQAGSITLAGSEQIFDRTETNLNTISSNYTEAMKSVEDICTIAAESGINTYLLDGTDSRVTFLNNKTSFVAPTTLGVRRDVSCSLIHNNGTALAPKTGDDADVVYGFNQSGTNQPGTNPNGFQSFCFDFVYDDTETITTTTNMMNFTMSDETTYKVKLPKSESTPVETTNIFEGKTISFYGDSITDPQFEGVRYTKGWYTWVKEILKTDKNDNHAVNGHKLSQIYTDITGSTATGDLILITGGTNDTRDGTALGTIDDDNTTTIYGCLNKIATYVKNHYPNKQIVFITPHYQTNYIGTKATMAMGIAEAYLKVSRKYAIPVIDFNNLGGIYTDNLSTYTIDNCHLNDPGNELKGKIVAQWLQNHVPYIHS